METHLLGRLSTILVDILFRNLRETPSQPPKQDNMNGANRRVASGSVWRMHLAVGPPAGASRRWKALP